MDHDHARIREHDHDSEHEYDHLHDRDREYGHAREDDRAVSCNRDLDRDRILDDCASQPNTTMFWNIFLFQGQCPPMPYNY